MFGIIFSGAILTLFISGCVWKTVHNKRQWNNGVCFNCDKGFWKSFDMCSAGETGYSCTNCDTTI